MPALFGTGSAEPLLWVVTNTRRCFGFRRIASAPSVLLRTPDRATRVRGFAALGSAHHACRRHLPHTLRAGGMGGMKVNVRG